MVTHTLFLQALRFYAHHGVYEHESLIGNNFEVDVEIKFSNCNAKNLDEITSTLDYCDVYQIVEKNMKIRSKILEHLAHRILDELLSLNSSIEVVSLKIRKLNPPLGGSCQASGVILDYKKQSHE
jgi:dihydroneopterin aldolase